MANTIKVVLADDHRDILISIATLLEKLPNIHIVGTAENGKKALDLAQSTHPDVIILDIDMPILNGLQVSARLQTTNPEVKILIFSIYDEPSIVRAAFHQGANGYVLKNQAASDLVKALEKVARGERFISAPVANSIL